MIRRFCLIVLLLAMGFVALAEPTEKLAGELRPVLVT